MTAGTLTAACALLRAWRAELHGGHVNHATGQVDDVDAARDIAEIDRVVAELEVPPSDATGEMLDAGLRAMGAGSSTTADAARIYVAMRAASPRLREDVRKAFTDAIDGVTDALLHGVSDGHARALFAIELLASLAAEPFQ